MNKEKKKQLEKKGWKIGSTMDFLGLTENESAYIELKIKLSKNLRELRSKQNLIQVELAKLLNSSQSRIAKLEKGDPSVSIDLLIKSLIALGETQKDIGKVISS